MGFGRGFGGGNRGGGRGGGFGGGRGGRGGRGSRGGGRGGGRGYDQGPPESVQPFGVFTHPCENQIVVKATIEEVPYFNALIYLENMEIIGKVDEIFGSIRDYSVSVVLESTFKPTSFTPNQTLFIDPNKLLPLQKFLPKPPGEKPQRGEGGRPGRGGGGRGGGRGFRGGGGRGGRGGFSGGGNHGGGSRSGNFGRGGGFRGGGGRGGRGGGFRGRSY